MKQLLIFTALIYLTLSCNSGKSKIYDLHFDEYSILPEQPEAEKEIRKYIESNAKFPESYKSIQFDNLSLNESYRLDQNYDMDTLKQQLERNDKTMIEQLTDTKNKIKINTISYGIRHSYQLMDNNRNNHYCIAHVNLDSNLKVTAFWNKEDFGKIEWVDKFGK